MKRERQRREIKKENHCAFVLLCEPVYLFKRLGQHTIHDENNVDNCERPAANSDEENK